MSGSNAATMRNPVEAVVVWLLVVSTFVCVTSARKRGHKQHLAKTEKGGAGEPYWCGERICYKGDSKEEKDWNVEDSEEGTKENKHTDNKNQQNGSKKNEHQNKGDDKNKKNEHQNKGNDKNKKNELQNKGDDKKKKNEHQNKGDDKNKKNEHTNKLDDKNKKNEHNNKGDDNKKQQEGRVETNATNQQGGSSDADCQLDFDSGPCFATLPMYYYRRDSKKCEMFVYGGCGGNSNRFDSQKACQERCEH